MEVFALQALTDHCRRENHVIAGIAGGDALDCLG